MEFQQKSLRERIDTHLFSASKKQKPMNKNQKLNCIRRNRTYEVINTRFWFSQI